MKNKYKNTPFLERGIIPTSTRTPEERSENEFSFGVRNRSFLKPTERKLPSGDVARTFRDRSIVLVVAHPNHFRTISASFV
jgi:hypothetical protein